MNKWTYLFSLVTDHARPIHQTTESALDGDPGQGKSMLTLDLAARITTARPWPDGAVSSGPGSVLLLCAEDSDAIIRDRLTSLDADLARVFVWQRDDDLGLPRLPVDHERLDQALTDSAARLVVIDPIVAFLDRSAPTSSDAAVRRALAPLARLAEKHRCAILLVRHLTKKANPTALYRGSGSIGFIAACRLAWLVGPDPKADDCFILAQSKNNYAPRQPSLVYSLAARIPTGAAPVAANVPTGAEAVAASLPTCGEPDRQVRQLAATTPPLAWFGPSPLTADELASQRLRPGRRRVRDFLRLYLESGPRLAKEVWAAARAQGFSKATILRAKTDLAIHSKRTHSAAGRRDY